MENFIVSESQNGDVLNPHIFTNMTEAYQYYTERVCYWREQGYETSDDTQDCRKQLIKDKDKVTVLLTWHT